MSYLWPRSGTPTFSSNGQFASGAQAFFYVAGTSVPMVVFANAGFTQPLPVPVLADHNGVFPGIYIPYGPFRQRVVDENGVLLSDLDNIDNPAPPTGGGGIVVTQDMVLQTGDPIWRPRSGIMAGFVRMNGNTIGSAASGATELASQITQNLFLFLWANFSNVLAPVSGGRGASAGADFTANKTIGIPSMRGRLAAGLDDMGGTPAGVLQTITTCTTNGTTTVIVANTAGIAVGDSAIVNGISLGPIISINGTTTFSANVTSNIVAQSVLVASSANITIGVVVACSEGTPNFENVTVTAIVDSTHFSAIFTKNHTSGDTARSTMASTVVLTSVAAGTATGISFRSSRFDDATVAANVAGVQNVAQTADQMPPHNHATTEAAHHHSSFATSGSADATAGASSFNLNATTTALTGDTKTNLTINNAGGGNPLSLLQPTMIGTWYMHL